MGSKREVDERPDDEKYRYGFLGCTPKSLQRFATPGWVLVFMCFCNTFQSMLINGLIGVILTSLEVRFDLSSSSSSWIASAYDVSTVPMLIIVSYFGSRSHRPKWTAIGLWILVVGTAIFILPHFTTELYDPTSEEIDSGLCENRTLTGVDPCATVTDDSLSLYLWVFIAGRILHGVGAVPLYTVCVTFLDDCVSKETFSFYIAIFYAAGVLGPALGYMVGGYLLAIYTDFLDLDAEVLGLSDKDPRWVGAWWLAFLIAAFFVALFAIPLSGLPRDLPGAAATRAAKVSEAYNTAEEEEEGGGGVEQNVSIKEFPSYFKTLMTNPTYVGLTLMTAMDSLLIGGFTAFGPKYLESQFAVTSSLAGILFGVLVIPGGAGGTIFGGYIIKRFKMKCARIMKWEAVFTVLIMLTVAVIFVTCDEIKFAGVNQQYEGQAGDTVGLISSCNTDCYCEDVRFQPICSVQDVQFYSPCHAGCSNSTEIDGIIELTNCSCITFNGTGPAATDELCPSPSCDLMPLWMAIFFIAMFLLFACSGMSISATVRCVPATHRSLAIGIQWIALRCLGTIPGPVLFGTAFDGACVLFEERCGDTGTCLFYDNADMALYLFLVIVTVKAASLLFIIVAWKTYKPPRRPNAQEVAGKPEMAGKGTSDLPPKYSVNGGKEQNGVVSPVFVDDYGRSINTQDEFTRF